MKGGKIEICRRGISIQSSIVLYNFQKKKGQGVQDRRTDIFLTNCPILLSSLFKFF